MKQVREIICKDRGEFENQINAYLQELDYWECPIIDIKFVVTGQSQATIIAYIIYESEA